MVKIETCRERDERVWFFKRLSKWSKFAILLNTTSFFLCHNAIAQEIALNCEPTVEIMFGSNECRFGCNQENDWPAVSITVVPESDKLSIHNLQGISFTRIGNTINFELQSHGGATLHFYKLDTITRSLEIKLKGKPAFPEDYSDVDTLGFATIQKNIFTCERVKKLF